MAQVKTEAPLEAVPASVTNRKGGLPPAHVWFARAEHGLTCEGTGNPFDPYVFAPHHEHINRGERFLRKTWYQLDGTPFHTRHCVACGNEVERVLGLGNENHR